MLEIFTTSEYDNKIAVINGDRAYTFGELKRRIAFQAVKLKNKYNIILLGGDNFGFIIQFWASIFSGKNIYLISDIKCYNDKLYLLVLKVNQYYTNGKYGLAKMDLDGSNFKYLNDLSFLEEFTNTGLRIEDDKIYALEPYNSNGPRMYIYSIKDETFEETEYINIDEDRYNFYKKEFPDYPYTEIQHIYNNCFYTENTEDNGKTTYVMYDPINKTEKKFDIDQYGERNKTNNYNAALSLVIDHLNDSWYLFSPKGVIKFNNEFEKEQVLLDETYNDKIYRLTSGGENIIKCELVDSDKI